MAAWMVREGIFMPKPVDPISVLADMISVVLREEMIDDPQGRRVRRNHAVRREEVDSNGDSVQRTLWHTINSANRDYMHLSFQQRRHGIFGDCKQLKTDADSYNENKLAGKNPIQISIDFTDDVIESEQPSDFEGEEPGPLDKQGE
jgi:hypothetical protein